MIKTSVSEMYVIVDEVNDSIRNWRRTEEDAKKYVKELNERQPDIKYKIYLERTTTTYIGV